MKAPMDEDVGVDMVTEEIYAGDLGMAVVDKGHNNIMGNLILHNHLTSNHINRKVNPNNRGPSSSS